MAAGHVVCTVKYPLFVKSLSPFPLNKIRLYSCVSELI